MQPWGCIDDEGFSCCGAFLLRSCNMVARRAVSKVTSTKSASATPRLCKVERPVPKPKKAKVSALHEDIEEDDDAEIGMSFLPDDSDDLMMGAPKEHENKGPIKEDPVLDRRIIEGMLRDRKALLEDLAKEGMTAAAVLRRAGELGLSEALLRQVKGVAADLAGERPGRRSAPSALGARTCLSCDRVFLSTGPGNRLCMRCRGGDAGLAQS